MLSRSVGRIAARARCWGPVTLGLTLVTFASALLPAQAYAPFFSGWGAGSWATGRFHVGHGGKRLHPRPRHIRLLRLPRTGIRFWLDRRLIPRQRSGRLGRPDGLLLGRHTPGDTSRCSENLARVHLGHARLCGQRLVIDVEGGRRQRPFGAGAHGVYRETGRGNGRARCGGCVDISANYGSSILCHFGWPGRIRIQVHAVDGPRTLHPRRHPRRAGRVGGGGVAAEAEAVSRSQTQGTWSGIAESRTIARWVFITSRAGDVGKLYAFKITR